MSINFKADVYETMIDNFAKSLTYIPVTKTLDNTTGDEAFADGTTSTITGAFFRKEDQWIQDKPALIQNADAVLLVKKTVTVNKNDKITYESETYRVDKVIVRRLGTTVFYNAAQLFKV